jgi:hypothetical protein
MKSSWLQSLVLLCPNLHNSLRTCSILVLLISSAASSKEVEVRVKVTLRLAVYRQSVWLDVKPPTEPLRYKSLYSTSFWREDGFVSYEYAWPFVKCTYRTYSMLLKNYCFCTTHKSSVSTGSGEQIMPILHSLCYNGSLVTWTVVSLTISKFKPFMFSVSGFALSYTANMFILMILYDFCLFRAQFCYIIVYIWKLKSCVKVANRWAPWNISNGAQNLDLQALSAASLWIHFSYKHSAQTPRNTQSVLLVTSPRSIARSDTRKCVYRAVA